LIHGARREQADEAHQEERHDGHRELANGPAWRGPLHQAVLNGDVPMIKLLLSRGANVAATTTGDLCRSFSDRDEARSAVSSLGRLPPLGSPTAFGIARPVRGP
jgi:hypothetical protein